MFIPVSLGQGTTSVDCTVDVTGVLIAQCAALYEGTSYAAGASIAVARNKTIRFTTDITAYAEISVTLAGKQFYWFVDVPKSLRYVVDQAFKRITGSTYGKLYHYPSGSSVPFADTGNITQSDVVVAVDFVKKDTWFFNSLGQVKKFTTAETPVGAVFAPRWAIADGVATTPFIVCDSKIYRLTKTFVLDQTFTIEAGCKAASGDVDGNLVLMYDTKLVIWNPSSAQVVDTISTGQGYGALQRVFVLHDNSYITAGNGGIKQTVKNGANWVTTTILAVNGQYLSFDLSATHLYVADGYNRCVRALRLSDWAVTTEVYDLVPRSVVVKDTTVYVGFFNSTTSFVYDSGLLNKQSLTTVKTYGAAYLNDYVVTDLYADANDVTLPEAAASPVVISTADYTVNTAIHYEWTCDFPRPEFVRVGTNGGTVKVNGSTFTSGYLWAGDVVSIDLPSTATYYNERWVSLVGRRSVSFGLRTEPRLFPDYVELPRILEAIPRQEYYFDYVISGITEGFSVAVASDANESEVAFSVNGSDYGFSGTIKTGDAISVRAIAKGLLTQRVAHYVRTVPAAKDVYSLIILPMTLNGVEIRRDKIDKQSQYSQVINPDLSKPQPLDPFAADRGLEISYTEHTTSPEMRPTFQAFREDMPTAKLQRHRGFTFKGDMPESTRISVTTTIQPGNDPVVLASHTWLTPASDAVKQRHRSVPMELLAQYGDRIVVGTSLGIPGVYQKAESPNTKWTPYHPPEWIRRDRWEWHFAYGLPAKTPYHAPHYVDWNVKRYIVRQTYQIDTEFEQRALSHVESADTETLLHQMNHVEPIFWSAEFRRVFNAHEIDTSWERAVPAVLEIDADYATNTINHSFVDAAYEKAPVAKLLAVIQQPTFVVHRRIEVDRAVPQFVTQSPDFVLPDIASGFGDQAQAEAYAATLEVVNAQFFAISGKWVFITPPTADSAACGIVVVPPDKQKRFGYIGGG